MTAPIALFDVKAQQALVELRTKFVAEGRKEREAQDYQPIRGELDAIAGTLSKESPVQASVASLRKDISDREWMLQSLKALEEPAPVVEAPAVVEVKDSLSRFQAIGWLRWERALSGPGRFVVEKGGKPLYVVQCTSQRYDLSLFVNREVGLIGGRRRPNAESLRVIDVEKLEVLASRLP